jgi:hypothetical protein
MFRKINEKFPDGIDSSNFVDAVIYCMQEAGKIKTMNGKDKKALVLINLTFVIEDESLKILIPFIIDKLISVENKKIRINPKIYFNCLKFS